MKKLILILSAATVLALLLLFFYPAAAGPGPSQSLLRISADASGQIHFQASLERNLLTDNAADPLRIVVRNDSTQSIALPALSLNAPGFMLPRQPWICVPAGTSSVPGNVLPAHSSCEFLVPLAAAARSGSYGITAVVVWQPAPHATMPGSATLVLGPVTLDRPFGAAHWTLFGRRFELLLKDLTLPILLLLVGSWFSDRQTAEAQRQQVRQLLLTRVMDRAEHYYLPFVADARRILIEADKIQSGDPSSNSLKLFLSFLLLLKRMNEFRATQGGIFFQTRNGEKAAGAAWFLFRFPAEAALGDRNIAEALRLVETSWDYATLEDNLWQMKPCWEAFQRWLAAPLLSPDGSFLQLLSVLDAFQAVMIFEADRSLSEYWYEEESTLDFHYREPSTLYALPADTDTTKAQMARLKDQLARNYKRKVEIQEIPKT